jgi:uncharacterized protein (DUF927 family)
VNYSFYTAVLPAEGPYCVVGIKGQAVHPTFHPTIADVVTQGARLRADQYNVFFALASFVEATARKADNVKALRCFFIDLDCGADKTYASRDDAAIALRKFITEAKLPEPYVVNSGRGLHAYWPFHEELTLAQWIPLARTFKALCVEHRLGIDVTVTADAARVLRMVDTENHKVSPALPVQLLASGVISDLSVLTALLPAPPMDLSAAKSYGMDEMTANLAGGDYPTTEFARIVRRSMKGTGCAQIAHAVQNAATLEEPLWRSALSIAWRCTDAETAIQMLSRAHPGYTAENTLRKAEATIGPITCDWYRENNSALCTGCTQRCSSPIAIGRKVEATQAVNDVYIVEQQLNSDKEQDAGPATIQVEIPAYPFPYFRGVHGGVYLKTKDKDGDPIEQEIYKYDLYLTSRYYDADEHGDGDGEVVGVNLHTPHDGIRRFVVPVVSLLTKEKMRDVLTKHGVIALPKELDSIMAYLASSIRNLQKMFSADRTRNQMGWTPDDKGFVVGEIEYTAEGARLAPAGSATRAMAPALTAKGSLEEWSKIANFYNRPGMEAHALALFFGMGAPLLRMIGGMEVRGAAINLMSNKSGTGKTTVQMVINSMFGHPSALLMKKTDTMASKMQWLGTLNTIAATMDEVTNITDADLSEMIYDIPQGRGKHRMESQSNRMRANTISWMTFVIMSSNSSLYDKLSNHKTTSDGELRRLIELRITRPENISKQESDAVFGKLSENYGMAGPVFMQYVLKNPEKVRALLNKIKKKIDLDMNLDQSDRFYSVILACAFAAATVAKQLKLHEIDIPRVYQYALVTIANIRNNIVKPASNTTMAAQETLTTYINENLNNALIVNAKRGGVPQAPIREPRGPLRIRYEPDTAELWIPAAALRDYFVSRQVDFQQAVKDLTGKGIFKNDGSATTKRIGSGAVGNFETLGVRCYCIDGASVGMDSEGFADDAASPAA